MNFITLIFFTFLLSFNSFSDDIKTVIYVAPVKGDISDFEISSKIITARLRKELSSNKKYKLVNPSESSDTQLIKDYNKTCISAQECARKEAQAQDAEQILTAEIIQQTGICKIIMTLEDINKKENLGQEIVRSSCGVDDLEDKALLALHKIFNTTKIINQGDRDAMIESLPPGAKVYINNEYRGKTPLKTRVPFGRIKLQLEIGDSKSYAPLLFDEEVEESKELWKIKKLFSKKNAYLVFNIKPANASIVIDGKKYDQIPEGKIPVDFEKDIKLSISSPNYVTQEAVINDLDPDDERRVDIKLKELPCQLDIGSVPNEASVKINGRELGQSTPIKYEVETGNVEIEIQKEGYKSANLSFYCNPGSTTSKTIQLEKGEDQASVKIISIPSSAQIEVNGKSVSSGEELKVNISQDVDVLVSAEGYLDEKLEITNLKAGQEKVVDVTLEKKVKKILFEFSLGYISGSDLYFDDTSGQDMLGSHSGSGTRVALSWNVWLEFVYGKLNLSTSSDSQGASTQDVPIDLSAKFKLLNLRYPFASFHEERATWFLSLGMGPVEGNFNFEHNGSRKEATIDDTMTVFGIGFLGKFNDSWTGSFLINISQFDINLPAQYSLSTDSADKTNLMLDLYFGVGYLF
jgi:hypothetical protein